MAEQTKKIEELTPDELLKRALDLQTELETAQEVIDDLKEQLEAAKKGQTVPTIQHGEDTYQVTSPEGFLWKGKVITLDDLNQREDLVAALVAAQAGVLVKVEKPAKSKKK